MNKLYSRHYYDELNVEQLTIDSLSEIAKQATHITILSAYYSISFLDNFFSAIPKKSRNKCKISIVLNGFAGFRLEEQREELKGLEDKLQDLGYQHVEIYLNIETPLFHSKLYCFHTEDDVHWFIGSANASDSAFAQNEEILFHLTNKNVAFKIYIEKVIKNSIYYNDVEDIDINCMIKFWRTGLIYYKPNANIQFTFSRLMIPNWVKEELDESRNPPPYVNPGEPWGPFNLKLALDFENEGKKNQVRHNPWSIETCFGYWIPSIYKERLDEKIYEVSEKKRKTFQDILKKMKELGKEYLYEQFNKYISGVKNNLDSIYNNYNWQNNDRIVVKYDDESGYYYYNGTITKVKRASIDVQFDDGDTDTMKKDDISIAGLGKKRKRKKGIPENELDNWLQKEFWRPPESFNTQFKRFVDRLFSRLGDKRHVERASFPLIQSTMPEIWSDSVALDEFSESFFEYILYRVNMKSKPLVIRSLQEKCEFEEGDDWEDVKSKMEQYINRYGWPDGNWSER